MRRPGPIVPVLAAVLLAGCTGGDGVADEASSAPTTTDSADAVVTTATSPSPSPSPTPSPPAAFGTGTVTVDGTDVPVSGDCDISRAFGQEPVRGLDEDVDVLLAVDNLTSSGKVVGDVPVTVRLLGAGAVEGRTVTSVGRGGDDREVTWEGEVTAARLRDREQLEFLDRAILHLEATQQAAGPGAPSGTRELVVDVACAISRPR